MLLYVYLLSVTLFCVKVFFSVLLGQEKNCSHEVTVVLFSRTFYEAKCIGKSIPCFLVTVFNLSPLIRDF